MRIIGESVEGLPLVEEGDDISGLVGKRIEIEDGDVVCVASTVISKAEGRVKNLDDYDVSERAKEIANGIGEDKDPRFAQAVLEESVELVMEKPFLLAVTRFGHIAPNAGIDRSNVEGSDRILLLPENPEQNARHLSNALGCPVIVTDTCGRPFRKGQTGVAIGWWGLNAMRDWKGERDLHGRELKVTQEAVVDEIAGFSNLLMGEGAEGTPVVVFRGLEKRIEPHGESTLFREEENDLVRKALLDSEEYHN